MKLIRVMDGIYRNESGDVAVTKIMTKRYYESDRPWKVTYRNGLGCKVVKYYLTFNEARQSLKRI
jgi:hypothetical protein